MTTIGLYFRGLERAGVNALRARLNLIAHDLGYYAETGPTAGQGNAAALLVGIDAGEVALVLLPDEQRGMARRFLAEQATLNPGPLGEALESLAESLADAARREGEADQREITDWS